MDSNRLLSLLGQRPIYGVTGDGLDAEDELLRKLVRREAPDATLGVVDAQGLGVHREDLEGDVRLQRREGLHELLDG